MDLFGYTVSDLQEDVAIGSNNVISGTLHYIADYSSAFGPDMDSGHYLVLHADVDPEEAGTTPYEITVTVNEPSVLDSDKTVVCYIQDKNSQTVTVVASAEGYQSITKVFRLTGLTLEPEG